MQRYGINKAVGYYCSKAGGRGRKLLDELSSGEEPLAENDLGTEVHYSKAETDHGNAKKTDSNIIGDTDKDEGSAKKDQASVQKW